GHAWWPEWPDAMQTATGDAVRAFARDHAETVDFHRWAQFELDGQLGAAAARARARGLPVGLYQDLAVGVSPAGGDVWGDQALFVTGVSLGAPPDALGPDGQNWGLPPMSPRQLARDGYAPWTRLVRSAMRHAGALRIDHAIGLFRQFWIPEGSTGRDGAYMRMPSDELLGILALESVRANGGAGALVVGEDLGTVPPEVGPGLARWGVLSSKVLYFERGEHGAFTPPRTYARTALATVNTHDLATLAGWWAGRDVALRRELELATDEETEAARGDRARERAQLVRLLVSEGVLDSAAVGGVGHGDIPEALEAAALDDLVLRAAVHAVVRRAPSWLVGLALEDLVGETEPVNLPGVGPDRFSSWTRRLRMSIEEAGKDEGVARAFGVERVWRGERAISREG
ncbi:MAG TPA: 4-alpha-glucanotransferase, partial [Gemmatirosa sp.]